MYAFIRLCETEEQVGGPILTYIWLIFSSLDLACSVSENTNKCPGCNLRCLSKIIISMIRHEASLHCFFTRRRQTLHPEMHCVVFLLLHHVSFQWNVPPARCSHCRLCAASQPTCLCLCVFFLHGIIPHPFL